MPPRTLKKMSEHYKAINKGNQKTILFFIIVPMTHRQDRQKKEEEKRMRLGKKRENTFAPKSHVTKNGFRRTIATQNVGAQPPRANLERLISKTVGNSRSSSDGQWRRTTFPCVGHRIKGAMLLSCFA